jgi:GntR family transcriptional regulator
MGSTPALRIFTLQPSSGVPIYLQLIQQVRRMVASGQLTPGTELPSVREVATEYTVNPTTISKA